MKADFTFNALGTQWAITIDGGEITPHEQEAILVYVDGFEKRFSRFLLDSEVNAFRAKETGEYSISTELLTLLTFANELREKTHGVYDPAVAGLLEQAGYDASYTMQPQEGVANFVIPTWRLGEHQLVIDGPVAFDLGGFGKGYCIDRVAELIASFGYLHYMVEAGGDMYGTTKADGSVWRVAIEYPGQPDMAAGTVELHNEALAVSDVFRRRWGRWHHIVDHKQKAPLQTLVGAAAVAPSACAADCMTSALFMAPSDEYDAIAAHYGASYLTFQENDTCTASANWHGEVF